MSTKSSSSTIPMSLLIGLIVFVVGLVIGLVVLGWNIWPVEWSDAAPENLEEDYRLDYLRSALGRQAAGKKHIFVFGHYPPKGLNPRIKKERLDFSEQF